jgi:uncharacterized protein (DUF697 family)
MVRSTQEPEAAPEATSVQTEDTVTESKVDPLARSFAAEDILKNHVIASVGVGAVPLPLVDAAGLVAIQIRLIRQLSTLYGHSFSEQVVRSSIVSLLGGTLSVGYGMAAGSLLKMVPGLGTVLGSLGLPVIAGATTYALGRVYIRHFEQGGTLLDLKAGDVRSYYAEQFRKGQAMVRRNNKPDVEAAAA